jgi:uncharacterized protein
MASPEVEITNNASLAQFEARLGDAVAVLQYKRVPGRVVFVHTEVPEAMRGMGVAGKLAAAGVQWARAQGLGVVAVCPFVQAFLRKQRDARMGTPSAER